jgi:hypothetical protein
MVFIAAGSAEFVPNKTPGRRRVWSIKFRIREVQVFNVFPTINVHDTGRLIASNVGQHVRNDFLLLD